MKKLVMSMIIGLGLMVTVGYANETSVSVSGVVEYQVDGDIVTEYSDGSSILVNYTEDEYTMWIPETEDYEYNYDSEEELMNAIEIYHGYVSDITYPESTILNPFGYGIVEEQLDKVEERSGSGVLELLESSELEIYYSDDLIDKREEYAGFSIAGLYMAGGNLIVMREDEQAIETALLHEIGHALDFNLGLRYNETLIDSYIEGEVEFTDNSDYYYSCIEEYIAESIEYYYNGLLPEDTDIYQELDYILGE